MLADGFIKITYKIDETVEWYEGSEDFYNALTVNYIGYFPNGSLLTDHIAGFGAVDRKNQIGLKDRDYPY